MRRHEVSDGPTLVERVDYEYDTVEDGAQGHPSRVVRKREDETFYRGVSLDYNKQGEIWFASEEVWEKVWDEELGWICVNKQLLGITEYRGNEQSGLDRHRCVSSTAHPAKTAPDPNGTAAIFRPRVLWGSLGLWSNPLTRPERPRKPLRSPQDPRQCHSLPTPFLRNAYESNRATNDWTSLPLMNVSPFVSA